MSEHITTTTYVIIFIYQLILFILLKRKTKSINIFKMRLILFIISIIWTNIYFYFFSELPFLRPTNLISDFLFFSLAYSLYKKDYKKMNDDNQNNTKELILHIIINLIFFIILIA